ncbi:unnamed protein product [Musa textilis]
MRLASRSLHKGTVMAGKNRKKSYGLLLLLLALGAALLSVIVLQKLRERRVLGLLLQDRERELLAFELLLQKERETTKEMKSRLDDLRNKTISLSQQKTELFNKLTETEMLFAELKRTQKEMEATLEDKENQIIQVTKQAAASVVADRKASDLTEILKKKEDEIEEMKHKLSEVHQPENITTEDDIVTNVTGLDYTKENEDLQDRSLASTNPGDRKTTEEKTQVGGENETAISHEDNSSEGKWVKLETIIENDGLKMKLKAMMNKVHQKFHRIIGWKRLKFLRVVNTQKSREKRIKKFHQRPENVPRNLKMKRLWLLVIANLR